MQDIINVDISCRNVTKIKAFFCLYVHLLGSSQVVKEHEIKLNVG